MQYDTQQGNKKNTYREGRKLSLFTDAIIIYVEKTTTKMTPKLLELVINCSKVAECKVNIKSITFHIYQQ